MCGIFAYLATSTGKISQQKTENLELQNYKIKHRGPDNTKTLLVDDQLWFGFHRLAINGLDHDSDEPITFKNMVLICNGEIYNYLDLQKKYEFDLQTHNDCEVIIHLFLRFGFEQTVKMLDGVFSIILYDTEFKDLYVANDPIGIRPLFYGTTSEGDMVFASEPISLVDICENVQYFPPGHYEIWKKNFKAWETTRVQYYKYDWSDRFHPTDITLPEIYGNYRKFLTKAVEKRLLGERPFACLLSGGLDSSLISCITAKLLKERGLGPLNTFSIGLKNSPDLEYARKVSNSIGSIHHEVVVSESEFLDAIPEVIKAIQSFDVTTVRASCGNYLIAKYISEETEFKIILNGDVSEEIHSSYFYSKFAQSPTDFYNDNVRLLKEVHRYDVLRSARCMEHFGLECRTPFADKDLIDFVMRIRPEFKQFGVDKMFPMEKALMRLSFSNDLISDACWRPKMAFSDGVSKKTRSWHEIIAEHVNKIWSDKNHSEFLLRDIKCGVKPKCFSKEASYYRMLFDRTLGFRQDCRDLIKEYWMPRFIDAKDPSARAIGSEK